MKKLKKAIIILFLLIIGTSLGYGLAYYLQINDYNTALDEIKNVTGSDTHIYAIKRLSAEGNCSGKILTFYSKGFEIAEIERWVGSEFTIKISYPTDVEFYRGCQNVSSNNIDELCTSILGAYMTIRINKMFYYGDEDKTYLPVGGERKDEYFEKIKTLEDYTSRYHSVSLVSTYNLKTNEYEYIKSKPEVHQYKSSSGTATVESTYNRYHLKQNEDAIFTLNMICVGFGLFLSSLISFIIIKNQQKRIK